MLTFATRDYSQGYNYYGFPTTDCEAGLNARLQMCVICVLAPWPRPWNPADPISLRCPPDAGLHAGYVDPHEMLAHIALSLTLLVIGRSEPLAARQCARLISLRT